MDSDGEWVKREDVWYVQTTVGQRQYWLQPFDEYKWCLLRENFPGTAFDSTSELASPQKDYRFILKNWKI